MTTTVDTSAADLIAERIIVGQERVVGAAAWKLARRVKLLDVSKDRRVTVAAGADPSEALDLLVREFTSITGELGARMCFMSAADLLREHPDVDVAAFRPFRRFA
jgi:hypothetical protein